MKRKLKIAIFDDRGGEHLLKDHYLLHLLDREYDVELSDAPELVFFSTFPGTGGRGYSGYKCLTVFFTGENVKPDFRLCDYAFTFEDTDDRNFQFPNFARFSFFEFLTTGKCRVRGHRMWPSENELKEYGKFPKSKFCGFIYSNGRVKKRIEFCKKLGSYKKVDCPGKVLNNMPPIGDGLVNVPGFFKRYKFGIAFENTSAVHYTTEKICWPLLAGSVPIYWGNPEVAEYFNPEAFINCHDYDNFDQVVKRVIEVDNDDALYQKYVNAPAILEGSKLHAVTEEAVLERLNRIVGSIGVVRPVSGTLAFAFLSWYKRCQGYFGYHEWRFKMRLKRLLAKPQ